mmetsp:Transcript_25756/g.38059  ORF Transcript_25756/g.38059 Transcript_25756/m.38059 type:complete len:92 (-) Transcript_25756:350-625(-)
MKKQVPATENWSKFHKKHHSAQIKKPKNDEEYYFGACDMSSCMSGIFNVNGSNRGQPGEGVGTSIFGFFGGSNSVQHEKKQGNVKLNQFRA